MGAARATAPEPTHALIGEVGVPLARALSAATDNQRRDPLDRFATPSNLCAINST
jgi:hypothetical protein